MEPIVTTDPATLEAFKLHPALLCHLGVVMFLVYPIQQDIVQGPASPL